MAGNQNDDLDWLYGGRRPDEPERTHVNPPPATGRSDDRHVSFSESDLSQDTPPRGGRPGRPASAPPPTNRRPTPTPAAPGPRRRPRRRRPVRTVLAVVGVLLLAWVIFVIATPIYAWTGTNTVIDQPTGERPPNQPGTTYLLVGSDSRAGLSAEERKRLGTGDTEGGRTDTMMLLYVPPSGKPALISIPRDSYVAIPGHGKNKINAAFAFGGPQLLTQTVEQATGLRIDAYVELGFGGFVSVIDALGGIEMCPKDAIKDHYSHLDIPAGCQNMDGATALGYVRMRYSDPLGDVGRMNRQREMIAAIVKKAATPMTVINPFTWWNLNTGAAQSVQRGETTDLTHLIGLVSPMLTISKGDGYTMMVPIADANRRTSAGSSVIWDNAKAKDMFGQLARGDTSNLERFIP
ncbi:LCP family protein [Granulicoccus phenolivorans]|uniref:LCP family protein n=1 Tax=Granulicoccus phenolivorans TaxID=266854 RepID=UPI0003FB3E29|nr:LCP family protein [Granulicoccus phenolivorans]